MSAGRDEGPVYYREIQKNAYLKRIPNEVGGSKLRPLGHKKIPLKPMWTLFCVHNGRTPFLEQYPEAESPATLTHKPVWRACLRAARHVTASVKPHTGNEYDFLVDTDHGPVRMLAPDWESMQDWVSTLRNKLHELKILSKGENVYCAPPAAPPPRAAARDPTSPLPPTPPVPPDRVPGIELTTPTIRPTPPESQPEPTHPEPEEPEHPEHPEPTQPENIDISNWDTPYNLPSTSQEPKAEPRMEPRKSLTKICGQNICLDDSILKRNHSTDSDEEFFAEIDQMHVSVENLNFDANEEYKQTLVVNNDLDKESTDTNQEEPQSESQATNITVIQVSNKPPHTAIPVLGPETNVFNFNFQQKVTFNPDNSSQSSNSFINIVNTEDVKNTTDNGYGTVFSKEESDYGHLSLTTTVNLTGEKNEGIYERLCMASTSNNHGSPLMKRLKFLDKNRKSSLPNLDVASTSESAYEYLFPNSQNNTKNTTNIKLNSTNNEDLISNGIPISVCADSDLVRNISTSNSTIRNSPANTEVIRNTTANPETSRNVKSNSEMQRNAATSHEISINSNARNEINRNTSATNLETARISEANRNTTANTETTRNTVANSEISRNATVNTEIPRNVNGIRTAHVNLTNSISVGGNIDLNSRNLRSNVERSHSQNAYDTSPRARDHLIRRAQNNSPKREKTDKSEPQPKPIWKRGLTELSLLSRLRGIGQGKRQESPTRHEGEERVTSPAKVVHRCRAEARVDSGRRRSSSLSNGQSPPASVPALTSLQPLRARQACTLVGEQRRGAAQPASVPVRDAPLFADYNKQVWVSWWSVGGARCHGRAGDRVAALRGTPPRDAQHARQLVKTSPTPLVDILFHRVPLGKIYVLNKRDLETIGIRLDSECNIVSVEAQSPASRAALPPPGKWAVTEVNNRPINLCKGGEEEMNRLSLHGTEVSVLLQPSALVKKLRASIKASRPLLSIR